MRIRGHLAIILITFFLIKCTNIDKSELVGYYKAKGNKNNIDSLHLLNNGTYQRSLYRLNDESLIYKHKGKWEYKDGMIELDSFYMDYDNYYKIEAGGFKESSQYCFFKVNKLLWRINIGTKMNGSYLYVKL